MSQSQAEVECLLCGWGLSPRDCQASPKRRGDPAEDAQGCKSVAAAALLASAALLSPVSARLIVAD
ncbi:MAG: hypothetical protein FRX49_12738 [Trebouxia sp. A1-2]|nr:MAG: hypothetical protein FRX49_12738 [Trebouxia sp. A1-2]